ncbi:unnamed protein product, partial [Linum tenue]
GQTLSNEPILKAHRPRREKSVLSSQHSSFTQRDELRSQKSELCNQSYLRTWRSHWRRLITARHAPPGTTPDSGWPPALSTGRFPSSIPATLLPPPSNAPLKLGLVRVVL